MRINARKAFVLGTWAVAGSVLLQFLLAGLGVFTNAEFLFWHAVVNASVIFFLPLLLVLIGWLGKVPGRLLWLTAAVSGLTLLQSLLLTPYHMAASGPLRAISGLHVVNALLVFWVTFQLLERTRAWRAASSSGAAPTPRAASEAIVSPSGGRTE
jgi:hypothetical protein